MHPDFNDNIIQLSDRVKELSYTTGTNNMVLEGAAPGFSRFKTFTLKAVQSFMQLLMVQIMRLAQVITQPLVQLLSILLSKLEDIPLEVPTAIIRQTGPLGQKKYLLLIQLRSLYSQLLALTKDLSNHKEVVQHFGTTTVSLLALIFLIMTPAETGIKTIIFLDYIHFLPDMQQILLAQLIMLQLKPLVYFLILLELYSQAVTMEKVNIALDRQTHS